MADEEIFFFANYRGWQAVKKKAIDENTEEKEVLSILSKITDTTSRKAFDLSGIDTAAIDVYAEKLTKGKRKAFSNLVSVFSEIKQPEMKEILREACSDVKLMPFAETYLIREIMNLIGYYTHISGPVLKSVYPDMKFKKPKRKKPKK